MINPILRILLVEDNPGDVRLIQEWMRVSKRVSYRLEHADCLAAGLKRLEDEQFDAVLLDLGLPDSQGLDTLKQLCTRVPDIPILVLTGLQDEQVGLQAVKEGAQDYLIKGQVSESLITRSITYALERKRNEVLIRESERHLKDAQTLGRIGYWEYDPIDQSLFWSDEMFILYERDPALGAPSPEEEDSYYSQEQKQTIQESLVKALETGQRRQFDFQTNLSSGKKMYFAATMHPIKGLNGRVVKLVGTIQDITERKIVQEALLDSEKRYRRLFESAKDGIVILDAETGQINDINPFLVNLLGFSKEKFLGTKIWDIGFFKDIIANKINFEELRQKGYIRYEDLPLETIDGRKVDVEFVSNVYQVDHHKVIQCNIRDITESKKMIDALRESDEKYRLVVENATDAILVVQNGMMSFVNSKAQELTNYTYQELTSRPFVEFIHPEDRKLVGERYLQRIRGDEVPPVYSFRIVTKDGRIRWVEIHAVMITWQGQPATLNFLSNIDERIQAEEQIKTSLIRTETALESTVKALGVTSELRDPYTAGHQRRVTQLACAIAREMDFTVNQINGIRVAGLLHDIGKILIPAEILTKPSKLTEVEFAIVKTHAMASYDILKSIEFPWPVAQIVIQHHEKLNGSGYPSGLKDDEILMEAKILCVADIVEAMSSHRPYRPALGIDVALEEMLKNKGVLYDPKVVDSCVKLFREKGFKFE